MISYIVVGLLFQFILVIARVLSTIRYYRKWVASSVNWFTNGVSAMAVVIIASIWSRSGFLYGYLYLWSDEY